MICLFLRRFVASSLFPLVASRFLSIFIFLCLGRCLYCNHCYPGRPDVLATPWLFFSFLFFHCLSVFIDNRMTRPSQQPWLQNQRKFQSKGCEDNSNSSQYHGSYRQRPTPKPFPLFHIFFITYRPLTACSVSLFHQIELSYLHFLFSHVLWGL